MCMSNYIPLCLSSLSLALSVLLFVSVLKMLSIAYRLHHDTRLTDPDERRWFDAVGASYTGLAVCALLGVVVFSVLRLYITN